jgi:hypothetical protein
MRRTGGVDGVKNRSGQWEGPGGGELNGCIMHQVHTSNIKGSIWMEDYKIFDMNYDILKLIATFFSHDCW